MKKTTVTGAACALILCAAIAFAQTGAPASSHQVVRPANLKWGPMPLPGAEMAVVSGDPAKAGPFVIRLKLADKVQVPAHWHPADEHVTVLRGTFALGMGSKYDASKLEDLQPGGYLMMPKEMRHFALSKGESVVQVHGQGPFVINWVNPADVPAPPAAKK